MRHIALFVVAFACLAEHAAAFHDVPRRARSLRSSLVSTFAPCTSPNTQTLGYPGLPACYPAVREDVECGFYNGPIPFAGNGKVTAKARTNGDFKVDIEATNLNGGCEGEELCGVIVVRATTHRCPPAMRPCTTQDIEFTGMSPTACCRVARGKCRITTTINSEVLGTLVPGDRTGIEVFAAGLRRTTGPNLPGPGRWTFRSGALTP
jgi:hypothetical protein